MTVKYINFVGYTSLYYMRALQKQIAKSNFSRILAKPNWTYPVIQLKFSFIFIILYSH